MDFFVIPRQRHDLYSRNSVSGLGFRFSEAQGAALGDGIHTPALGLRLGEEVVGYLSF